ncbi:MAG: hypothetical protein QM496_10160 [Verrucomicrobiota bacterium]
MLSGFDESPTAANAKLDKIEVTLGVWIFQYRDKNDLEVFLAALQPMSRRNPVDHIDVTPLGEDGIYAQFGWIFNNRRGTGNRTTLTIRTKDHRKYGRLPGFPLFSGSLIITKIHQPPNSEFKIVEIRAELSINPTRFAHHQHPSGTGQYKIWTNAVARRKEPFPALDGNDNILTGVAEETYSQPEKWNSLVEQYWGGIVTTLTSEFQRANRNTGDSMEGSFSPDVNVSYVEVYWEVADEDAVERVRAIEPIIARIGRSNSLSFYPTIIRDREVNCPSIRTKFNQGLEICVYAKTEKRVRLELKFNLQHYSIEDGHKSTELRFRFLPQLCQFLCGEETGKMETIFEEIREIENSNSDLHTLLGLILDASESTQQAKTVINLLISNRGITPTNHKMTNLVRRLKSRGVLIGSRVQGASILPLHYLTCLNEVFPHD